ncbi:unnamed protein product [Paramecium pentaurelia]|uniref:WD-40 repeat protein n=1 Tax=Paramecium pentaurelia TaxID=43138 RepID=A0A8S1WKD8_9CILI|nr:unnamed protein product [Paramecium pentaurelia]
MNFQQDHLHRQQSIPNLHKVLTSILQKCTRYFYPFCNIQLKLEQEKFNFKNKKKKMQSSFQEKDALVGIFDQVKDVDEQIYGVILEILSKEKIQDCIGFLTDIGNQRQSESQILKRVGNFTQADTEQKLSFIGNDMKQITDVLRKLQVHDFNYKDFTSEENEESTISVINSIKDNRRIIEFMEFLVQLTSINETLIQCGSNSLNLLIQMKVDIRNKNFENINIQNTFLVGANFVRCNFSGSIFNNVNISGINLNGALLFNCRWKELKIHELNKLVCHKFVNSSSSYDSSIRLWDVKTGQQKAKLDGHTSTVYSICFSSDRNTLASGSFDKSIRLWDIKTGQQIAKLDGHTQYVKSVCFSPDGNILASGSEDSSIRLWDVKTGQQKTKLDGHSGSVWSVCISLDGNTLGSGSDDKSIRLWDVKTGQQIDKLDGHTNGILSVCFSPDGNTLASGSNDKSIRLWDVKTLQQKTKLDGHTHNVRSVCFSPDGSTFASGSNENSIPLRDVKTGQEIKSSDINYKDIFAQFKIPLKQHSHISEDTSNYITTLLISQQAVFQAEGALILQGYFINQSGIDLKTLFKQKGSCLLENLQEFNNQ